jgi:hypothetical protein
MSAREYVDEEDEDKLDDDVDVDREGPDPSEMDSSDDPDLEVCPHCRKLISEEAERCHHCGNFISAEDEPLSRRAWITIAIVSLLLLAMFGWVFSWMF